MEDHSEPSEVMKDSQAFFVAAMKGDIAFFEEARNREIESCNEEYFLRQTSSEKYNFLHIAIQYQQNNFIKKVVLGKLLPDAIINKLIYQQDNYGNTPLHVAQEEGNTEFLKLVLEYEHGVDGEQEELKVLRPAPVSSNMKNKDGNTPLHLALIKQDVDVAGLLVMHYHLLAGVANNEGNTPLHVAAALGNTDIFKVLLEEVKHSQPTCMSQGNNQGYTPLHVASFFGNVDIAGLLLREDPELARAVNKSKETALHLAIIKHQIIGKKIEKDEDNSENLLISELELQDRIEKSDERFVEGDMNPTSSPSTPMKRDLDKAEKIGDISLRKDEQTTMNSDLENASKKGDLSFLMVARIREIENGNYFLGQNESLGDNILHIAVQFKRRTFIEEVTEKRVLPRSIINKLMSQKNDDDNTPLHVAAKVGDVDIFKMLHEYEYGQSFLIKKMKNADGCTPFHVALIHHNIEIAGELVDQHRDQVEQGYTITSLIKLLVQKESSVACFHDNKGYTPLHRAAFLPTSFGLRVIKIILKGCPESAKVADKKNDDTILHLMVNRISSYKKGKELLQIPEIESLKTIENMQGKTPLKLALKLNFRMVRLLLKNNSLQPKADADKGSSTHDLQQLSSIDKMIIAKKKMTSEKYGVVDGVKFQFLKDKLYTFGMNFLSSRDSKGRNVLHNLMQLERGSPIKPNEYLEFVKQVVDICPALVFHLDFNRNTPLHILLQNSHDIKIHRSTTKQSPNNHDYNKLRTSTLPFELLNLCCKYAKVVVGEDYSNYKYDLPWLVQNDEGNTPLHGALKANHILPLFSEDIVDDLEIIAGFSNKYKETPLHLLAGNSEEWSKEVISVITIKNEEAATWQDKDGLTPIMRAVQAGHINTVKILNNLKPEASEIPDKKGRTIWHLLVNQPSSMTRKFVEYIEDKKELKELLKKRDIKGKTPLHLALESRSFSHARLFLQCSPHDDKELSLDRLKSIKELLDIQDGDGVTPGDLLASIPDLPQYLEQLLSKYPDKLQGYRSAYGISTKEMNDYVNTMGVIAALLATISFTAAFTVPGGVIQDDKDKDVIGSPLLVDVVAFQAFMFFDISTMCLSTMVLFCLLWILAADTKRNSVMLMDFSILMLLISFYTTLLTFMTGVYVTTIHVKPWIAIYTLIICTTLLLLMHKCIVIEYLGPIGSILSALDSKLTRHIKNLMRKNEKEGLGGNVSPDSPTRSMPTEEES